MTDQDNKTSVSEVLTKAADLLEKPGAWTQGYFANNQWGVAVMGTDPKAVCWCAVGAIQNVAGQLATPLTIAARKAMEDVINADVAGWNDASERTQAEVVAALRAAASQAEGAA